MRAKPLISIVVPVFNEEANVRPFYERVAQVAEHLQPGYDFEFVFTDNHSRDQTFDLLTGIASGDARVRVFRFSKNFGFQRSIMTGYAKCAGDVAIQLDVDLQDPPELIPTFVEKWLAGADVVYGIRTKRQENFLITFQRSLFYRLIDTLSEEKLPVDAGDFRLVTRRVIDLLKSLDDAQPYLRGSIATLGFMQVGVPYERSARTAGESKFPFSKLVSLAVDGILNHSIVPLRLATYLGMTISALTLLLILFYTVSKLLFHADWPAGWATMVALQLGSLSVTAMMLGVIGEYLGRMYQQMKKQPLTIIEASIDNAPVAQQGSRAPIDMEKSPL